MVQTLSYSLTREPDPIEGRVAVIPNRPAFRAQLSDLPAGRDPQPLHLALGSPAHRPRTYWGRCEAARVRRAQRAPELALLSVQAHGRSAVGFEFARRYLSLGRAEGRVEGRLQARAELVLRILELRRLEISETQRRQILRCTGAELLSRWFDRAVTVTRIEELFH